MNRRREDLPIARPATETRQRFREKLTGGWEPGVCVIKRKMEATFPGGGAYASTEPTRRYQSDKHRDRKEPWKGTGSKTGSGAYSWVPVSLRAFTGVLSNRGFRCQLCSLPEQLTAELPRSQHVFTKTAVTTWIHGLGGVAGLRSPETMYESFGQVRRE